MRDFSDCPSPHMVDGFKDYVEHGVPPGSFLRAFLQNDLKESVARADVVNQMNLVAMVRWAYNTIPAACWGDAERVKEWVAHRGFEGL